MRRAIAILNTALVVLAITLALDFTVSQFIPPDWIDDDVIARWRDEGVHDASVPNHHDFLPNLARQRQWGADIYPFLTDAYGLRTGKCAGTDAAAERDRTVFVIGDSFAEGIGVPFEHTFAGLLACAFRERGEVVRNLGVAGYSPVIYYRKLRAAAERLSLEPRRVIVLLDISDIPNDANDYFEEGGRVHGSTPSRRLQITAFLKRNFLSAAAAARLRRHLAARGGSVGNLVSRWTVDPAELSAWGHRGLALASANLDKSLELCRQWRCEFTLVVYPWPAQIDAGDRDSIQVRFWRQWVAERRVAFINAFEPFFREPKEEALRKYYIEGDVHWTAAGHRLVFDEVWPQLAARPTSEAGGTSLQ